MEEYKSNSFKSKEKKEENQQRPVIEKVVQGKVRKQKKTGVVNKLADVFLAEDISDLKQKLIWDVVVPKVKDFLYNTITNGADQIFYGGNGKKRQNNYRSSYQGYYQAGANNSGATKQSSSRDIYNFDNLLFDARGDADAVLENMQNIIDQFGTVSVADLYDLSDVLIDNTTASNYGWKNISTARVVRIPEGYILSLPKPILL